MTNDARDEVTRAEKATEPREPSGRTWRFGTEEPGGDGPRGGQSGEELRARLRSLTPVHSIRSEPR